MRATPTRKVDGVLGCQSMKSPHPTRRSCEKIERHRVAGFRRSRQGALRQQRASETVAAGGSFFTSTQATVMGIDVVDMKSRFLGTYPRLAYTRPSCGAHVQRRLLRDQYFGPCNGQRATGKSPLISILASEGKDRPQKNDEVEPERPVIDVFDV